MANKSRRAGIERENRFNLIMVLSEGHFWLTVLKVGEKMNWLAISFKYAGEFPKVFGQAFVGDFSWHLGMQEPRSNRFHSDLRKTRNVTPDKYSKQDCHKNERPAVSGGPNLQSETFNLK
jgi:hypothetical protein